jgi:acetylornithine deacetylase/succinyl-diaminopimelate desuccinylase-like protein
MDMPQTKAAGTVAAITSIDASDARAIEAAIDSEELTALVLELCNIPAPVGHEARAGQFVYDWLRKEGFAPRKVGMVENRFNVIGRYGGRGDGPNVLFTAHLDTQSPLYDDTDRYVFKAETVADPQWLTAWLEDGIFKGYAATNDRGPLACTLIAAKALKKAGYDLSGTLYLTACPGEIGPEPAEECQGVNFLGKEIGALYMLTHGGVAPDYVITAEGTDFGVNWVGCGYAYYRITLTGEQVFTPLLEHPRSSSEHPNPIVRMAGLIEALQRWARDYDRRFRYESTGGTALPRVQIGAIRGGNALSMGAGTEVCSLYVEVILTPAQTIGGVDRELKAALREAGFDRNLSVEPYVVRHGFEADAIAVAPIHQALNRAHQLTRGEPIAIAAPFHSSMWRDHNVFNMNRIPAAVMGPGRWQPTPAEFASCAKIYALAALALCGKACEPV